MTYTNSDLPASALYLESLPLFTRGLVSLPEHPTLLRELRLLERIPGRIGKDQVTHPRGVHDDLANAVCGCLVSLVRAPAPLTITPELLARVAAMPRTRQYGSSRSASLGMLLACRSPDPWPSAKKFNDEGA